MFADLVGRAVLPEMTVSEELFGRLYYVMSSCADIAQTITKIARSILTSALVCVFLGQSSLLNKINLLSWNDVGFSVQMTFYSVLGILNPRLAWVKKCNSHVSNLFLNNRRTEFSDWLLEEWKSTHTAGLRVCLAGQMVESGVRCVYSYTRFFVAEGLYALSLENAKFVKLLSDGARQSAQFARMEMSLISQVIFKI